MPMFPVDRTVVISLPAREDRLAAFRSSWALSLWSTVLPEPEVFHAVDGQKETLPAHLEGLPEVYGCWASHLQVLEAAFDDEVQTLAVFEDDAVLQPVSRMWLEGVLTGLPEGTGGLWLDASILTVGNRQMHGSWGTSRLWRAPMRTHAYVLSRPLMHQFINRCRVPGYIDKLYAAVNPIAPIYGCTPSLAIQADADPDTRAAWMKAFAHDPQRSNRSRWLRRLASRTYDNR